MANKKAAIFDFDGTISDTFGVLVDNLDILEKTLNIKEFNKENIENYRHKGISQLVKDFKISKLRLVYLISKFQKIMGENIEKIKPFEGISEFLDKLNKLDCDIGIVSSNSQKNCTSFVKINDLAYFFDFIYAEPKLFSKDRRLKKLMKKHGYLPENVVYVGDEIRDVEGGKKAGVRTIAVTWGYNSAESLERSEPDALVNTFDELYNELVRLLDLKNPN